MAFQTLRGTLTFSRQCHNAATGVGLGSSRTLRHFQQMFNALHLLNDVETAPVKSTGQMELGPLPVCPGN